MHNANLNIRIGRISVFIRDSFCSITSFVLFSLLLVISLAAYPQTNSEYRLTDPTSDTFIVNSDRERFGENFYCCDISDVYVYFDDSNMNISITVLPEFNENTYVWVPFDLNNTTPGLVNTFWPEQTLMDFDASVESNHDENGFRVMFYYLHSGSRDAGVEVDFQVYPEKIVISVPILYFGNTESILARFMAGIDVPNSRGVVGTRDTVPDVQLELGGQGSGRGMIWATRTLPPLEIFLPTVSTDCVDTDGDGWGWDGFRSCRLDARLCIDSDGDGWGWNGVETCTPTASECVDTDGDGWGWNGVKSCPLPVSTDSLDESVFDLLPCVDVDGDGWGWQEPPGRPDLGRSCAA